MQTDPKPVLFEVLKTKDVKQAYRLSDVVRTLKLLVDGTVDSVHDPDEESSINSLVTTYSQKYNNYT